MTHEPIGIGLVGAGGFGRFCLEAFATMPEVRIAAIADIDEVRANELGAKYGAHAYSSIDDLLRDESVQIVALNTPPYLHADQGLSALQAGKHLFCEKPLALTVEEGKKLLQTAAENNLLLTVDYVMRHNPFWESATRLSQSRLLGGLQHMNLANHAAGQELPADHWFWDKAKSGGIWIEHGVHFFDAFAWVSGQKGQIQSSHAYYRDDTVNDRVEASATYGDAGAHFYHAFDKSGATEQTTVRLTFERGYVTLREWVPTAIEILADIYSNELKSQLPAVTIQTQQNGREIIRAYEPNGKSFVYQQCIQAGMGNLVECICNPQSRLLVTGMMAVESLRMAIAAERLLSP